MRVIFYGSLAETIGREIACDIAPGETVAGVRARLAAAYPAAAATLSGDRLRAAIDDVVVGAEAIIPSGAALAFLPPLSGG